MPLKQQVATVPDRLKMKTKTELEQKGILDLTPSECLCCIVSTRCVNCLPYVACFKDTMCYVSA